MDPLGFIYNNLNVDENWLALVPIPCCCHILIAVEGLTAFKSIIFPFA
jgi:hypothetical protein